MGKTYDQELQKLTKKQIVENSKKLEEYLAVE